MFKEAMSYRGQNKCSDKWQSIKVFVRTFSDLYWRHARYILAQLCVHSGVCAYHGESSWSYQNIKVV